MNEALARLLMVQQMAQPGANYSLAPQAAAPAQAPQIPPSGANQRQLALAQELQQQGTQTSPIVSPWQGIARLAQAYAGKKIAGKEKSADEARTAAINDLFVKATKGDKDATGVLAGVDPQKASLAMALFGQNTPKKFSGTLSPGEAAFEDGKLVADNPKSAKDGEKWRPLTAAERKKHGISDAAFAQVNEATGKIDTQGSAPGGAAGASTLLDDPDALDIAIVTTMYDPVRMNDYTSKGAAGQPIKDAINKGHARKLKEAGMSPADLVRLRTTYRGEVASQQQLIKQRNMLTSFENLQKFNGVRLLELIDKVDDTGIPLVEAFTRPAKAWAGDVDAAEFKSVLNAYQTEAARLLTQPNLVGQLSDTARQEMQHVVSGAATAAQLKRVINRINLEVDMRATSIDEKIKESGQTIAPFGNAPAAPPAPGAAPRFRIEGGRLVPIT